MGFKIWNPKSRKIVCGHSVFFDEIKMHKKPTKTVEIHRVTFQEDGHELKEAHADVSREINFGGQAPLPQGQEQEVREDGQVVAQPT